MSLKNRVLKAVGFVVLGVPLAARADGNCSNATLNGSYGLHATGIVTGIGDFAAVGRFTFDGRGNLTGRLFVRLNGNNSVVALSGNYAVSPECIVSDVWRLPDGSTSTHVSILVNEGKKYVILNNTVGEPSVISGEATRQ